jgi:hypothetical protein
MNVYGGKDRGCILRIYLNESLKPTSTNSIESNFQSPFHTRFYTRCTSSKDSYDFVHEQFL